DGRSGPTWAGRCPMTVENVLDAHRKAGIDISVVSNAAHYLRGKAEKDELAAIRRWTDYAAEIEDAHRGTLYALATILPCGGAAYLKEIERAILELKLKGVFINSSHKGHYPDDDAARPPVRGGGGGAGRPGEDPPRPPWASARSAGASPGSPPAWGGRSPSAPRSPASSCAASWRISRA